MQVSFAGLRTPPVSAKHGYTGDPVSARARFERGQQVFRKRILLAPSGCGLFLCNVSCQLSVVGRQWSVVSGRWSVVGFGGWFLVSESGTSAERGRSARGTRGRRGLKI